MSETTRRTVLTGVAGITAAVALTACGDDDTGGPAAEPPAGGAAAALGNVADIPVGGGKIFAAQKVVVTQPTEGQIKAFSATCTHQACTVSKVEGGLITCPCHNSNFRIADGSVVNGPATKALPAADVTVADGKITIG
jgi:nitrite reductase/ring-hydroxylating ferredoxin subunit